MKNEIEKILAEYSDGKQTLQDATTQVLRLCSVSGVLPHKELIERLVTEEYYNTYGTNGSENDRLERIKGAKFIIAWLVGNNR